MSDRVTPYLPSGQGVVELTTTGRRICGPNPKRLALTLSAQGADLTVSNRPDVTDGAGIKLFNGFWPLVLRYSDCGEWLRGPLFGALGVGTTNCHYVECSEE